MKKTIRIWPGIVGIFAIATSLFVNWLSTGTISPKALVVDNRSDFQKGLAFGRTEASNLVAKAETVESYLGIIPSEQHVYFFPYAGDPFRRALEIFIREKEELELVSMAGDSEGNDHGIHGSDVSRNAGYFVVFRKK
ncbi:MAG: hypothetical protein A2928_03135 [Candidatus Taylorbacteria bacterium RIFCSPLOWO2_01_FULL_45_15b]|uniref:Uncharacterized protein n=1 Tax=Candidatus Taylorbacteria bacterium RIFCSPLOWO2_01_FULL_45_15b TaxID=1802319 RepID=A0A1G2NDV9_9BACT|nr:MAG: hypothetical protein A2928_03135 [Candidatus Taylorbacteria bacterium RIFCSPLOWO2_01_FULL_45_15b]